MVGKVHVCEDDTADSILSQDVSKEEKIVRFVQLITM